MHDDSDPLDLAYLAEIVWEIGKRVRQGTACDVDIDALLAVEFVARTPALKRLASSIVDQAMLTRWHDYILNAQLTDLSCQLTF